MIRNNGIHDGKVFLASEWVTAMLRPHAFGEKAAGGLGVLARDESGNPVVYRHGGSTGTNVWIDFERDLIGIMLTQTSGSDIKSFRFELERLINVAVPHPRV